MERKMIYMTRKIREYISLYTATFAIICQTTLPAIYIFCQRLTENAKQYNNIFLDVFFIISAIMVISILICPSNKFEIEIDEQKLKNYYCYKRDLYVADITGELHKIGTIDRKRWL